MLKLNQYVTWEGHFQTIKKSNNYINNILKVIHDWYLIQKQC